MHVATATGALWDHGIHAGGGNGGGVRARARACTAALSSTVHALTPPWGMGDGGAMDGWLDGWIMCGISIHRTVLQLDCWVAATARLSAVLPHVGARHGALQVRSLPPSTLCSALQLPSKQQR